jgi:hypothetical protein
VYAGGFLLGGIAGPMLGAVAVISLRAPFFLYAGTLVVAGGVALVALRAIELRAVESGAGPAGPGGVVLRLPEALRNRSYRAALAGTLAGQWAVVGVRSAIVPLFVVEALHLTAGWTYTAFFVASAVSGSLLLPVGRYADTRGRRPVLAAGLLAGGTGLALLAVSETRVGLLVAMVAMGAAGAALSVAPGAIVGDVVGGRGGTVVATYQMAGDLGAVLGPLVAGWLADSHGYPVAFGAAALVTIIPLGVVLVAPETARGPGTVRSASPAGRDGADDDTGDGPGAQDARHADAGHPPAGPEVVQLPATGPGGGP